VVRLLLRLCLSLQILILRQGLRILRQRLLRCLWLRRL